MNNDAKQLEDSFVFYPSFVEQICAINNEKTQLIISLAVMRYGVYGELPDFSSIDPLGMLDAVFLPIRRAIDDSKNRRRITTKKRSESGKSGGAPKGNQNAAKRKYAPDNDATPDASTNNVIQCADGTTINAPEWWNEFNQFWTERNPPLDYDAFVRREIAYKEQHGNWRTWNGVRTRFYADMRERQYPTKQAKTSKNKQKQAKQA